MYRFSLDRLGCFFYEYEHDEMLYWKALEWKSITDSTIEYHSDVCAVSVRDASVEILCIEEPDDLFFINLQ